MKLLERVANVFVVVGVAAFLVIAVRGHLFKPDSRSKSPAAVAEALRGKTVQVSGLNFPRAKSSVLLVISTTCHFCQESLPFYRSLSNEVRGRADILAILPQSQQEAATFLKAAQVDITQIATASPSQIGVTGTPTMLLLDPNGKVEDVWLGRLDEAQQAQVLSRLAKL
jgi:hypothetical protein